MHVFVHLVSMQKEESFFMQYYAFTYLFTPFNFNVPTVWSSIYNLLPLHRVQTHTNRPHKKILQ